MTSALVTRRTALKFSALITLAAHAWHGMPAFATILPSKGYGADPDLLKRTVPWHRTLSAQQLTSLAGLCDIVLPAELSHPSAAAIEVHDFLDEWVSAPYPQMQADRVIVLNGLTALDESTVAEHSVPFARAAPEQQAAVFDRLCGSEATLPFASRIIELICGGYYTTRAGHAAIGYIGNVASQSFPAPTPEIVRHFE